MNGVLTENIKISHEDERRILIDIFNKDIENFKAEHCKILKIKKDCILGGVWHDYKEVVYILQGETVIELENIDTKEKSSSELKQGDRIIISKRISHGMRAKAGTIVIELWEKPYVSDEVNNHKYEMG